MVGQSAAAVAVCKPAGMPVHVAGAYSKNTVLGVLQAATAPGQLASSSDLASRAVDARNRAYVLGINQGPQ